MKTFKLNKLLLNLSAFRLKKSSFRYLKLSFLTFLATICIASVNAQYRTIKSGSYTSGETWLGGEVPPEDAEVTIAHKVTITEATATVSKATMVRNGRITVRESGALMASDELSLSGGSIYLEGGTVNVGTSGGGDKKLVVNTGTLKITDGIINVNGSVTFIDGKFIMSGGAFNIDPNTGSASNSVEKDIDIFTLTSEVITYVTGGTITFVDPPFNGNGRTLVYTGSSANANWEKNTIIFGGTNGINTNSGSSLGFNIDTKADGKGGSYLTLGNVIVNGGSGTNRFVTGSQHADNGFDIGGDLTINAGSEARSIADGAVLTIGGDIYNKGRYIDYAGIYFGGRSGPNTKSQFVTNYDGKGYFLNNTNLYKANAHFTDLVFNNIAKPKAVTFDFGDGVEIDGAVGVSGKVDFINGAIDIGSDNQFVMRTTCTSSRVNGFLLRGGAGQLCKEFPLGASSFTYYIADTDGEYECTPVTISLKSNNFPARIITVKVKDDEHPKINKGGKPDNYISRFWQLVCTSPGTFAGTLTFNYLPEDVSGNKKEMKLSNWDGANWNENETERGENELSVDINQSSWSRGSICQVTGRSGAGDSDSEKKSLSVIANENVSPIAGNKKVSVYPNPVSGGRVNLQLTSMPAAKYNVAIYNNNGQKVYGGYINHTGGSSLQPVQLPNNHTSGIYRVIVSNEKEKVSLNNILVND